MFDINTKIQWRTGGRGVFRTLKGTVIGLVKRGKLPLASMRDKLPHGDRISNRDRYIVEIKDGAFAWANVNTAWKQGEKAPPHKPRFHKKDKVKNPAKAKKTKAGKTKAKNPAKAKTEKSVKAKAPAVDKAPVEAPKKSSTEKPKTTWYSIVDGKIVSVRKVVCPEGFSKDKPTLPAEPAKPAVEPAAEPAAEATAPAAEATAPAAGTLPTA